jgi:hypothetical protein
MDRNNGDEHVFDLFHQENNVLDSRKEAEQWRQLARRARRMASCSGNAETERGLMHVAVSYEDLARRLEVQSREIVIDANSEGVD